MKKQKRATKKKLAERRRKSSLMRSTKSEIQCAPRQWVDWSDMSLGAKIRSMEVSVDRRRVHPHHNGHRHRGILSVRVSRIVVIGLLALAAEYAAISYFVATFYN